MLVTAAAARSTQQSTETYLPDSPTMLLGHESLHSSTCQHWHTDHSLLSPALQSLEVLKVDSKSSLSGNQKPMCKNGQTMLWLLLQGDHLQLLLQGLHKTGHMPSHGALMGISAGLFLPTTWLPDLGALSYVGALGVVSALGLTGGLALQQSRCLHCTSVTA